MSATFPLCKTCRYLTDKCADMADGRSSGVGAGENRLKNVGKFAAGVLTSAKSCGNITKAPETARVLLRVDSRPKAENF